MSPEDISSTVETPGFFAEIVRLLRSRHFWRHLAIILVLFAAALLRFNKLNWDEGRLLHPDERYVAVLAGQIHSPASVSEYFDSGRSPLNPFNTDWGKGYVYGTLPLFIPRYMAEFLDTGCATLGGARPALIPALINQLLFGPGIANCQRGAITFYNKVVIIGRVWSGIADLLSILLLYLIGRRLFGWRAAILASAFSALSVLLIQQAHFFTVDSTTNLFTTLTIYFTVLLVMDDKRWSAHPRPRRWFYEGRFMVYGLLAGVGAGCGIASKVSVWPLIPLIILAAAVAMLRDKRDGWTPFLSAGIALVLAGITTFASFRITQPYAFVGNSASEYALTLQQCSTLGNGNALTKVCTIGAQLPQSVREILTPSVRWIQQLNLAEGYVDGTISAPFADQWANRAPITFPLINLVFYGLGVPLGIAAILGFLYAARQLWRRRRWKAYVLPVFWVGFYFFYQSTQFTKSIRYLVPIYPLAALCAAVGLLAFWRYAGQKAFFNRLSQVPRIRYILLQRTATATLIIVLAGTALWAEAYTQIFNVPVTRLTASRWVFLNVPTAVTLHWTDKTGRKSQTQLPVKELNIKPGAVQVLQFRLEPQPGRLISNVQIELNHVSGQGEMQVRLASADGTIVLQRAQLAVDSTHTLIPLGSLAVLSSQPYRLEFQAMTGSGITARTSVVANEHWDDAVPQPIDGKDPYGSYYNGLSTSSDGQIQNYNEDTPDKLPQLLNWLDEADYLAITSNRLYASIPRLPWRYPMASEYYRALFNGELGFELAADFTSFPRLGPFIFNDQEMPQILVRSHNTQGTSPGIQVPYPTAEEAFSVYDHPRVLIFRKTAGYSRALAQKVLGKYDLTQVIQQTPLQTVNTPHGMVFDDRTRAAQESGGTWSDLFPRDSLLNQSQAAAVIAWVLLVELLGLSVFPIIALSTSRRTKLDLRHPLLDAGYSFSKVLALLIVAAVVWWLSSTRLTMYTALQIWVTCAAVFAAGLTLWVRHRARLAVVLRHRWKVILASELVFLLAFAIFLVVRAGNPDLWHPYMGGEKPMDFAFLNGILKSTYFPPMDPWFSNGYINYYYFGWVIIGSPIKALGIDPSIAYNLVIPLLFGLTASGAFGLGSTFYARLGDHKGGRWFDQVKLSRAIIAGLLAALFVVGLGNLREIDVLVPAWQQLGGIKNGVAPLTALIDGIVKWLGHAPLPIYPNWPYWNPTRPTAGLAVDSVQIAEFPLFTFLYADLHAHMMAMPIAFLALAFALAYARGARRWPAIALGALAAGALWPTNSWDYPIYLLVGIAAIVIGALHSGRDSLNARSALQLIGKSLPAIALFGLLTRAFYIPYLENYGSAYNTIEPWTTDRTPLDVYLTIYGLFLVPIVSYFIAGVWRNIRLASDRSIAGWVTGFLAIALTLILVFMGVKIALIAVPLAALAFLAAIMPGTSGQTRILWLLMSGAFMLTLFVELFTLRGDIGRMNTLFKFYIQAWLILGVASAVVVVWVFERLAEFIAENGRVRVLTAAVFRPVYTLALACVVFLAALYPAFAIPAKMNDRYVSSAPAGLDGMVYMVKAMRTEGNGDRQNTFPLFDDYLAIKWMQDNVKGSPTIIEGTTGGDLYRWGNRFSIYTGLPTVIGWQWHERQQRAALSDQIVYNRDNDVSTFYSTTDIQKALTLIRRYNARYIILGQLERSYYDPAGLAKFQQMVDNGFLRIAYRDAGTTVYAVNIGVPAATDINSQPIVSPHYPY